MAEQWTPEEYKRYINLGIIPDKGKREQKKLEKVKEVLDKQDKFKGGIEAPLTLFDKNELITPVENKDFREIELWLAGEPMPKQSFKSGVTRHRSAGYHICPWTGQNVKHGKGDVLVYKNKKSGNVDVIPIAYIDKKYTDRTKEYKIMIQDQLPKDFVMFTKEVHIMSLEFIFKPLASFSKKLLQQIEDDSVIKYKTTKPDWENTAKLLMDSMNGLVYQDDSLICTVDELVMKYGAIPGIKLKLKGI